MGSKPRKEEYVTRLVLEKQRAIYWLCSLLERDSGPVREGARKALGEIGYDQRRIEAMLLLGEPGARASENRRAAVPVYDDDEGRRTAGAGSVAISGTSPLRPYARLLGYGPGTR